MGRYEDQGAGRGALLRLQARLDRLRQELTLVRAETQRLLDVETIRPLAAEEADRMRQLKVEAERLRWELEALWREFEHLRASKYQNAS
jgi:hypothetical protein